MGKKADRINTIITILKEKNGATVKDLAITLNVSEMTIRRDLEFLNDNNIVNNVYGAAIYNNKNNVDMIDSQYDLNSAKNSRSIHKNKIGKLAATLIEQGDTIIIDTGSTTEKLAYHIPLDKNIHVLCYNINIMNTLILKPNVKLTFSGGFYHSDTQMCESPENVHTIQMTRASKVFISAAGVHKSLGLTCATNYESPMKRAIIESSNQKILLCDSSKFGVIKSSYFANFEEIDIIVTDTLLTQDWIDIIERSKIELYMV